MDRWEAQRHLFFNASRRGSELSGETSGNGGGSAARMSGNGVNYNGQRSKNGVQRKLSTLDYRLHRMESLQISDTPITSADRHSQKTVAKKRPMNCLKHVEKHQMVILVHVKCATGIVDVDEFTKTDPYVDVSIVNQATGRVVAHRATATKMDDLNPQWDELFVMETSDHDFTDGDQWSLNCTVYDHDICESDESVGSIQLDLSDDRYHVCKMADLGHCSTAWAEREAHTYDLVNVPTKTSGGVGLASRETAAIDEDPFTDSKLTISIVRTRMRDFHWWCNRVGLDENSAFSHGEALAAERLRFRNFDAQNESVEVEGQEAQEARAYLKKASATKTSRRHSMALMIEKHVSTAEPVNTGAGETAEPVAAWSPIKRKRGTPSGYSSSSNSSSRRQVPVKLSDQNGGGQSLPLELQSMGAKAVLGGSGISGIERWEAKQRLASMSLRKDPLDLVANPKIRNSQVEFASTSFESRGFKRSMARQHLVESRMHAKHAEGGELGRCTSRLE